VAERPSRTIGGLATYWTKRGEFNPISDAHAEFSGSVFQERDVEHIAEAEAELDERMKTREELMDPRLFLVNEMLLGRNPNGVEEWSKGILLWRDNDDKVTTYINAIATTNWRNPTPIFHGLFVGCARRVVPSLLSEAREECQRRGQRRPSKNLWIFGANALGLSEWEQ